MHCLVIGNTAYLSSPSSTYHDNGGGGIYNGTFGTVSDCIITENTIVSDQGSHGGGIYNRRGTISNCTISKNTAISASYAAGGGIYNGFFGVFTDCIIIENKAVTTASSSYASGGGILNDDGGYVSGCIIRKNIVLAAIDSSMTTARGGGVENSGDMNNCIIDSNIASAGTNAYGGGIVGHDRTISKCIISGNSTSIAFVNPNGYTSLGGGVCFFSSYYGSVEDCVVENNKTITNNKLDGAGGGIYGGEAIRCIIKGNSSEVGGGIATCNARNCLFLNNNATGGGGAYNGIVINSTFVKNRASSSGGGAFNGTFYNCMFWKNDAGSDKQIRGGTVTYSAVQGGYVGARNINISQENEDEGPLFVDPETDDYQLQPCSPCVNKGENRTGLANTTDLAGNPRIYNTTVDMGAYELQTVSAIPEKPVITRNETTLTSSSSTGNQWYLNNQPITGATQQTHICTQNGQYFVLVTNQYGCSAISESISITNVSIAERTDGNASIAVYPNPTRGQLIIDNGQLIMENVAVYDVVGRLVGAYPCGRPEITIDVSHLAKGMYFLKIGNKMVKFLKE
jgi:hypothetical protein